VLKGVTSAGERKEMVDALLQQTNLWDVRKKALSTYSGGMKQRFGIPQALLANPRSSLSTNPPPASTRRAATASVVDEMPTRAGVDPYNKLVDRIANDNMIDVTRQ
jgi:ABC-type taurine transport system ATPase subunit